jgi:hypothetical protein
MRASKEVFADPWLKKGDSVPLPLGMKFVCSYYVYVVVDHFRESIYFRRAAGRDELWIESGEEGDYWRSGCVVSAPSKGRVRAACQEILKILFRARVGFESPSELIIGGLVKEEDFTRLLGELEKELDDNAEKARQRETEIIRVARELKLSPEPTGKGPDYWQAGCPGGNHPVYINAADNEFGCGWCKRKGGPEELRAFVEERLNSKISTK